LKQHSFFLGVDFQEVSREDYTGCLEHVDRIKVRNEEQRILKVIKQKMKEEMLQEELKESDLAFSVFDVPSSNQDIIIEGSLIKRNWYNKLQLRHFQLFNNGDIKYHLC
jgi:hypothetical protein